MNGMDIFTSFFDGSETKKQDKVAPKHRASFTVAASKPAKAISGKSVVSFSSPVVAITK